MFLENPLIDNNFALACSLLTGGILGHPLLEDQNRQILQADLEGDFIANALLKQIYRRIYNERVKYNVNFSKTKHCMDYFAFLSRLFRQMGYNCWVIRIDETELIGRLEPQCLHRCHPLRYPVRRLPSAHQAAGRH